MTEAQWGAPFVVVHGTSTYPERLPGFVAEQGGERVGLVTYQFTVDECEIVTLNSLRPDQGIGSALLEAVVSLARQSGYHRVWLITTNDNLRALGFYQKRGFALVAVHRHALEHARQIKPQIPLTGEGSIPLRDQIELEMVLLERRNPRGLWWKWLWVVAWIACAGGVVLALGAPLFPRVAYTLYASVFGTDAVRALSAADLVMINVALGIGGGLQAGASVFIASMARTPIRHSERWAWQACVLGLALWLVLDTGLTLWYVFNGYPGLWLKVANDLGFVLMFGIPYAALYRYCRNASFGYSE